MGILDSDIGKSIKKELESEVKREVKKSVNQSVKSVEKAVGINTSSSSKKKSSSSSSSSGTSNSAAEILGSLAVGVAGMAVASKLNSSDKSESSGQGKKSSSGKANTKAATEKEEPLSEMAKLAQQAIPKSDAQPVNTEAPEDVPEQITQENASPISEATAPSPQPAAEPPKAQSSEPAPQPVSEPAPAVSPEPVTQEVPEPAQSSAQSAPAELGGDAEAISDLVKACKLLGCDESEAKERIMSSFSLSDAVASLYIDKFWNA